MAERVARLERFFLSKQKEEEDDLASSIGGIGCGREGSPSCASWSLLEETTSNGDPKRDLCLELFVCV